MTLAVNGPAGWCLQQECFDNTVILEMNRPTIVVSASTIVTTADLVLIPEVLDAIARLHAAGKFPHQEGHSDTRRLDALEKLIKNCPHADFDYNEDEDEGPVGFTIVVQGCETSSAGGRTLRDAVDDEMAQHPGDYP